MVITWRKKAHKTHISHNILFYVTCLEMIILGWITPLKSRFLPHPWCGKSSCLPHKHTLCSEKPTCCHIDDSQRHSLQWLISMLLITRENASDIYTSTRAYGQTLLFNLLFHVPFRGTHKSGTWPKDTAKVNYSFISELSADLYRNMLKKLFFCKELKILNSHSCRNGTIVKTLKRL